MPARRPSWGFGLVAAFGVFIGGVLVMVWVSVAQRVDLVSDEYYEEGLRYQKRIQAKEHAGDGGVAISLAPDGIRLQFPSAGTTRDVEGIVVLYRPDNRGRDRSLPVALDSLSGQTIAGSSLHPGLWRVKVQWSSAGVEYYAEQAVLIP